MIDCRELEDTRYKATIGCCGILSFTGLTAGMVTAFTLGSICGTGYLLLGGVSAASLVIIKNMKFSKHLQDSLNYLHDQNLSLKENNKNLEMISEGLQADIDLITESIKLVGDTTHDFVSKLRTHHEKLKQENDRHKALNRQQGMLFLMDIFKHFDSNQDFSLSTEELKQNEIYLKSMFPNYTPELFNTNVTFEEICHRLLPPL